MKAFATIFSSALFVAGCATVFAVAPADTPAISQAVTHNSGVNEPTVPVSVAGVWNGVLNFGSHTNKFTVQLKQSNNAVEGTLDIYGAYATSEHQNLAVRGKLEGNKLTLKIPYFAYGYITATVVGNRLEDGYYNSGGPHHSAGFSAERISN